MLNYILGISFCILLITEYRLCYGMKKVEMFIGTIIFTILFLLDSTIICIKFQQYMKSTSYINEPIVKWIIGEALGIVIMLFIIISFGLMLFETYKQKIYEENNKMK